MRTWSANLHFIEVLSSGFKANAAIGNQEAVLDGVILRSTHGWRPLLSIGKLATGCLPGAVSTKKGTLVSTKSAGLVS